MWRVVAVGAALPLFVASALGAAVQSDPYPYSPVPMSAMHADAHNSDNPQVWLAQAFGAPSSEVRDLGATASVLSFQEPARNDLNANGYRDYPSLSFLPTYGPALGSDPDQVIAYSTTGKVHTPNLHAFDPETGVELWHSAAPHAVPVDASGNVAPNASLPRNTTSPATGDRTSTRLRRRRAARSR